MAIVIKPTFVVNGVEYSAENYQMVQGLRREISELMSEQTTKQLASEIELGSKDEEIARLKVDAKTQADRAEDAESDRSILISDNRFLTILFESLMTETTGR